MKISTNLILIIFLIVGGLLLFKPSTPKSPAITQNQPTLPTAIPSQEPTPTIADISPSPTTAPTKVVTGKVQLLKATYGPPKGFYPTEFTVKANQPVRLEVLATEDGVGCMGSIMIPDFLPLDIQFFRKGETNVFEFTPATPGEYPITCAMGVPHATIIVQ